MNKILKSNLMLFMATFIWGITFLFQKDAANFISPFYFTALRFTLGTIILLPLAIKISPLPKSVYQSFSKLFIYLFPSFILGPVMLIAAAMQQWGLEYTSEQNSGFITTLYVIITPMIAYIMGGTVSRYHWLASVVMIIGLYFLSFENRNPLILSDINIGDLMTLFCAFFWALHIILIGTVTQKLPPLWIAVGQNVSCAFFGFLMAFMFENPSMGAISEVYFEILFAGFISVGIAYTLQVIGQKHAPPAHAVIILSLEAVIATIAAMIYRGYIISPWAAFGAALMFLAIMIAELLPLVVAKVNNRANSDL